MVFCEILLKHTLILGKCRIHPDGGNKYTKQVILSHQFITIIVFKTPLNILDDKFYKN